MASNEPKNEAQFLERESRLARDALQRLRGEMVESLVRTADVNAWVERYPWPSLGTAAAAGLSAGWILGRSFSKSADPGKVKAAESSAESAARAARAAEHAARHAKSAASAIHPASRLVSGLGTLVGAFGSVLATSAAQALGDALKATMRDAVQTEPPPADVSPLDPDESANGRSDE